MKRLILIFVAAVVALTAAAETHYRPHISIGGRAGVSMGQVSFSPSVKESWNQGTTGAVTFRYTEEKLFGLVAEFGWVQRGWKEDFEEHPFSYNRKCTYLTLPVMTHIYFGSKRFKTFINLGPSVSYMISESTEADFNYEDTSLVPNFPANRHTEQLKTPVHNKFDYGISAGLGFEFYLKPRHSICAEARFYYGLGNIYPSSKADTFSASRNMTIELTLGYNFRLH